MSCGPCWTPWFPRTASTSGALCRRSLYIQQLSAYGSGVGPAASAHELAAIDLDDLANQVVRRRRGQEYHRPGDLLRRALAPDGYCGRHALAHVGRGEAVVERSGDDAGGHAVYQDVVGDELLRHRPGEGADAPFGRRVGCRARDRKS